MKPTASAPMATASSASSSLVIPQILTNTRWRLPTAHAQAGDRFGPVAAGDHRLAHQHGVEAGGGERDGVLGAADARLGDPHDAVGHRRRRRARPARCRPRR